MSDAVERPARVKLFVRFGIVGLLNTAFSYLLFVGFVLVGIWPGPSLILAAMLGIAFNFQTAKRLVFLSKGNRRWVRFALIYAGVLALDWLLLRIARELGINELVAQFWLVLPLAGLSFLCQSAFVFRSSENS
jgi:putative flippase GtrA